MGIVFVLLCYLRQRWLVPVPTRFEVEHERIEERHGDGGEGVQDDGGSARAGELEATGDCRELAWMICGVDRKIWK
jgi:hypothetical protein